MSYLGVVDIDETLLSPTLDPAESSKSSKREGNGNSEQTMPTTHAKTSRRTTSLLNLFMSNSQGTFLTITSCSLINPPEGDFCLWFQDHVKAEPAHAVHHPVPQHLKAIRN